jgi:hypothetical protein
MIDEALEKSRFEHVLVQFELNNGYEMVISLWG